MKIFMLRLIFPGSPLGSLFGIAVVLALLKSVIWSLHICSVYASSAPSKELPSFQWAFLLLGCFLLQDHCLLPHPFLPT